MASHSSLYHWKRQENKPVFSSRGNVQEWVKQVQRACDDAAKDIFGDNVREVLGRRDFCVDDDVILEGQDLIDSWIQKKNVDDLLAECEIQDEVPTASLARYDKLSRQFQHHEEESSDLFGSSHNYYEDNQAEVRKQVFDLDEDFDEECAVHEVVYNMLEKDVVDLNTINDEIKFKNKTKKFNDPTPKMKLRHEEVKKRANERKIASKKAHLKKINKKNVEEEARKQLQREDKQRLDHIKREEDEIRKEMVKIRRVMQEENTQRIKHHSREVESEEKAKNLAKKEVRTKQEESEERLKREYEAKEAIKRKLLKQHEKEELRKQGDLKLLQSCFSSWYALVVNKQIKCGKARALLEWRRKLRIWNAWRKYVLRARSDRETRVLNEQMKERHRKEILADRFYRQMLFHRCLTAWLSWIEKEKEEKILKEQHDNRAKKMASLLKAASSGQLWQERNVEEESGRNYPEELEEISLKPFKLQAPTQEPGHKSGRNSYVPSKMRSRSEHPTQAWPHQRLKEMKAKKPMKKHNALLDNIGSITTRTESSTATMHGKDSPRMENTSMHERASSQEENQRTPPPDNKDVNLRSQNLKSNAVQNNGSDNIEQKVDNSDRNIARLENVTGFPRQSVSTRKQCGAIEDNESQQSTRSTSTTSIKSKVTSRKLPTKPLHLAMEERAKVRAERKSLLDARKRAAEEEKLAKLKQEQEEKEREILAEKQAALQKRREEMKLAKQRELEKQQRLDEIKEMNRKADEHYHYTLLRKFGFLPWKKLIQTKVEMLNSAEIFRKKKLQSSCFQEWLAYTRSECERRNHLADNMYKSLLLRFGWQSWRKYRHHLAEMDKIALEFSRRYIAKKYVKIWQDFVIEERLLYWDKENKADEHNDKRLLRQAMTYWKKYIPLLKEEEKREKRRNDLRKHVMSLLPDFQTLHVHHST